MALLELASAPSFDCTHVVACLDRRVGPTELQSLVRNFGWVGFTLTTLDRWTVVGDDGFSTSDKWLFLSMEV